MADDQDELPTPEQLLRCAEVLQALARHPEEAIARRPETQRVRAEANRLIAAIQGAAAAQKRKERKAQSRRDRQWVKEHDRAAVASTGVRQGAGTTTRLAAPPKLVKARRCYVCGDDFRELHPFYDSLCPACAAESWRRREQEADLSGRTALVTGGRIKIGHAVVCRLLRAGARVILTTRFPCDAARRLHAEPDSERWSDRLQIHGLDLRDLEGVERFARELSAQLPSLELLVNNAAQTVRRPPRFYASLLEAELAGPAALPPAAARWVAPGTPQRLAGEEPRPDARAALRSQVPLVPGDETSPQADFPEGARDAWGQQLDARVKNSWVMQLGEISRPELVEAHYVNALAPFLLLSGLLPALERSPRRPVQVVNVAAREGTFADPGKLPRHPHTNMSKAALNMLTRTLGPTLAERGVFMASVDTGWVSREAPLLAEERARERGALQPPLDAHDAAARVLAPVFDVALGLPPVHSCLLRNFRPSDW